MKHLDITVSGKVQGVCFRAHTVDKASELGVTGWVCNQRDGTVFLQAEGEDAQLEKLLDWLQKGPDAAYVQDIHVAQGELQGFGEFTIRHG